MNIDTIRKSIENENVSYEELAWLQSHPNEVIATGDATLCEWAGIDEDTFHKYQQINARRERLCKHCQRLDLTKVEIVMKGKTYVPIGDGWGFHNQTFIVRDEREGVFRILKDELLTQPIEYCPKCGRKLDERSK